MTFIDTYLDDTLAAFTALREEPAHRAVMQRMADAITASLRAGGKLLICGNGGSASDAQHIAAEFVGRLMYDRAPLPALALGTDGAILTAVANDYGYEHVFARQVLALARPGDVLLAISTSGNSPSILRALEAAGSRHLVTLGFTGAIPGRMNPHCTELLSAPARQTALIQQLHITAAHIICALVETALFPPRSNPLPLAGEGLGEGGSPQADA